MSLKNTYHKCLSLLLLAVMSWNIAGWMGMGLISMAGHHHHDEDRTHCEVSFCYCEIEDGQKVCVCHHPELHAQQNASGETDLHTTSHHSGDQELCYYTKDHTDRDTDLALIVMDKLNTILTESVTDYLSVDPEHFYPTLPLAESSGYPGDLLRPPMA